QNERADRCKDRPLNENVDKHLFSLDGNAIGELLHAGDDHASAGFQAAGDDVVISEHLAHFDGTLLRDKSFARLGGKKAEVLPADAHHRYDRHRQARFVSPDDSRANELLNAHRRRRVAEHRLGQHRLRGAVNAGRHERDGIRRNHLALSVKDLHGQAETKFGRSIQRHLQIRFEPLLVVDGGDLRRRRDAIPFTDRNVADDSGGGRRDAMILKLDLIFADLRVERREIGLRGFQAVLRRIEFVLADGAGGEQRSQPLDLSLPVLDVCLPRRALRLRIAHGGDLFLGIDLEERRARTDAVARLHKYARDASVHLRLDGGRVQRFYGRDELRRAFDGFRFDILDLDCGGRWTAGGRLAGPGALPAVAACDGRRERQPEQGANREIVRHV